jgi:hypothetical protein
VSDEKSNKNLDAKNDSTDSISIIYHQRNDSPKYIEIKRKKVLFFLIGLPTLTIIAVAISILSLITIDPISMISKKYTNQKQNKLANLTENLEEKIASMLSENEELKNELTKLQTTKPIELPISNSPTNADKSACPEPVNCAKAGVSSNVNSIGLSTLSLFKPIQGQKDLTRPFVLNLSGFKTAIARDTINLQFNIIPALGEDVKISGHIIVLMKNEIAIQAYPLQALSGNDFQINYASGETFSTQRFRPVDASFVKPRKSGMYSFTVFIFSRTGDLIHYQTTALPLKL